MKRRHNMKRDRLIFFQRFLETSYLWLTKTCIIPLFFIFQSVYPLHFGDEEGKYVTQYYCNDYDDRLSLIYVIYQVTQANPKRLNQRLNTMFFETVAET